MQLTPENVSPEVFARMLTDPELRPLLRLNISASTAETVAASKGLTAHYYDQWSSLGTHSSTAPAPIAPNGQPEDADAVVPHGVHHIGNTRPAVVDHPPLDLRLGVHALVWPAASLLMIGLSLVLALALARSDDRNLGLQAAEYWTGVGYFFAIVLGILGVVFGIKSIRQGLTADGGTPRRGAAITLGTIGLVASTWFILSWLVGWITL